MTYYIAPTGDDTNGDGTAINPWRTLNQANANSALGDTIIFKNGTYTWATGDYDFNFTREYKAENTGLAVLDAGDLIVQSLAHSSDTNITGLVFQNGMGDEDLPPFKLTNNSTDSTTFNNCRFNNIRVGWNSSSYNYGGEMFGIEKYPKISGSLRFVGCAFFNIYKYGNNKSALFYTVDTDNVTITLYNNTFCFIATGSNSIIGFLKCRTTTDSVFIAKNNIFYAGGDEIIMDTSGSNFEVTFDYNNYYNFSNPYTGNNNIEANPKLIDELGGDLHLQPDSPCINNGIVI